MDIAVDCWGRFDFTSALRIAKALEPYNILYLEDAMISSQSGDLRAPRSHSTSVPICISETLATRYEYRAFLEAKACSVVMYDVTWCGGVSEAKKIADLADTYLIPTSPHTCGGPLLYCLRGASFDRGAELPDHGEQLLEVRPPVSALHQQCADAQGWTRHAAGTAGDRRRDQAGVVYERRRHSRDRGAGLKRARQVAPVLERVLQGELQRPHGSG